MTRHGPRQHTSQQHYLLDFWLGNVFVHNAKTRGDGYVTREEFAVITGQLGIPQESFDSDANFYGARWVVPTLVLTVPPSACV